VAAVTTPDRYAAFTGAAPTGAQGNPYKDLRYLVIEDNEATRQTLRLCIQTLGGFAVSQAQDHADALVRIRRELPDVILCDYILGEGRTGQQLLEQLRRNRELPERAIFIMVTGERAYERVISAVELVPDDYILKPFAPEVLRLRLERVIQRKKAFLHYYALREDGRDDDAIAELDRMVSTPGNAIHRFDILRAKAALQLDAGALAAAATTYQAIVDEHPFPWAKAGLARVYARHHRHDDARSIVDDLIEQVPNYFDAYDLKAEICTRQGAFEEALKTLATASGRTPCNYERKKAMSVAAGRTGDFERARAIMDDVVRNDQLGDHSVAFLDLARSAMDAGDHGQAAALLARAVPQNDRSQDEEARLSRECMSAVMDEASGNERFDRIRAQIAQRKQYSVSAAIDITRAALHFSDLQLANLIAERILSGPDARQAFTELLAIYQHEDLEQPFRDLQKDIVARMVGRRREVG
jgi:DNA-binding response OmpR family regulator